MKLKVVSLTMLLIFLTFTLFTGESYSQEKLEKMKVGCAGYSAALAPLWVAKDSGMLAKYGIDAEIIFISGVKTIQAMIAGETPISVTAGVPLANSVLAGSQLVMIAMHINTLPYSIISSKDIAKPEQLKGKKIAISQFGSSSDFSIRYALEKFGLSPTKDVTLLQMGDQSARYAALTSGNVNATIITPPLTLIARKQGFNTLADLSATGFEYPHEGVAVTKAFIKEKPQTVMNFLKGFLAGIQYWKAHKEETKKIMAKYMKLDLVKDKDELEETYIEYSKLMPKKPYPTAKGFKAALDEIAEKDPRAKAAKPEQFMDLSFMKELDQNGFIDSLYK